MAEPGGTETVTPEQQLREELGPQGGLTSEFKSYAELEEESVTDHLTGILNRRGFDRGFKKAYEQAKRTGDKLQIIFIDGDRFKDVNFKYTRPGGDKVLIAIADSMKLQLRTYDVLARWGGDEFVAVASQEPFKKSIKAEDLQQRLNDQLKRLAPEGFDPKDLNVTIGIVDWDGHSTMEELMSQVQDHMDQRK